MASIAGTPRSSGPLPKVVILGVSLSWIDSVTDCCLKEPLTVDRGLNAKLECSDICKDAMNKEVWLEVTVVIKLLDLLKL